MQSIVLLLWLALCSEQDVRQRQISDLLTLGVAAGAVLAVRHRPQLDRRRCQ